MPILITVCGDIKNQSGNGEKKKRFPSLKLKRSVTSTTFLQYFHKKF